MLKAITFDFWDTLYKAPRDLKIFAGRVASLNRNLKSLGYEFKDDILHQVLRDCWRYANNKQMECGLDITPKGHVEFILDKLQIKLGQADWERVYKDYTSALLAFPPQLNEGVSDTLPELAKHYKLGVICNTGATPGFILRNFMKSNDIYRFFEVLVFSDEVCWAKPNVKIFNYTLEKLQIHNSEAAHIGDNSKTDVLGANRAGMTSIWLAPVSFAETPDCDYQVREIRELLDIFLV
ncbi:MAG: HAD family hydrolase [Syntrophomonas sp.]|nr:HAD family hydrolase [Syntrophomonas sp.]